MTVPVRPLRIATLVVPSLLACFVTLQLEHDHLLEVTAPALVALWVVMAGALAMRFIEARGRRVGDAERRSARRPTDPSDWATRRASRQPARR
jgi:hypothetical protein